MTNTIPPEVKAAIEAKADTVVERAFAPLASAVADLEQSWKKEDAARLRRVTAELIEVDLLTADEAKPFLDLAERAINDPALARGWAVFGPAGQAYWHSFADTREQALERFIGAFSAKAIAEEWAKGEANGYRCIPVHILPAPEETPAT